MAFPTSKMSPWCHNQAPSQAFRAISQRPVVKFFPSVGVSQVYDALFHTFLSLGGINIARPIEALGMLGGY